MDTELAVISILFLLSLFGLIRSTKDTGPSRADRKFQLRLAKYCERCQHSENNGCSQ